MLFAQWGTVGDIEILWTILAASGLGFSTWVVREAYLDKRALKERNIKNGRSIIARSSVWSEMSRWFKQAIFLVIGIISFFLPNTRREALPLLHALANFIIVWGLITASALTTFQSILSWYARRELRKGLE